MLFKYVIIYLMIIILPILYLIRESEYENLAWIKNDPVSFVIHLINNNNNNLTI